MTDYTKLLNETLRTDYKTFLASVRLLPVDEIIRRGYEISYKEDIVEAVELMEVSPEKAKAFLESTKFPLETLYNAWLNYDVSDFSDVAECARQRIEQN